MEAEQAMQEQERGVIAGSVVVSVSTFVGEDRLVTADLMGVVHKVCSLYPVDMDRVERLGLTPLRARRARRS